MGALRLLAVLGPARLHSPGQRCPVRGAQHSTAQHSILQHSGAQHSPGQPPPVIARRLTASTLPSRLPWQVNVDLNPELRELGQGMGVTHLPWFHLFAGAELVASFSANTSTVATLRAEIDAHKAACCAAH